MGISLRDELIRKVNADLANNLGNLLNRTLTLIEKHCNGLVPAMGHNQALISEAEAVKQKATEHIKRLEFAKSMEVVFALVDKTNKYLNDEKPWNMFKNGKQKEGEIVLYTVLEILRSTTILIYAFVPNIANNIWSQLGYEHELEQLAAGKPDSNLWTGRSKVLSNPISPGQKVKRSGPVFNRIEEKVLSP